MNYVQGPNRAFGVGETKEQNAVIKVYTISQLKNALTQIYKLPSGTGTIQIASDITIREPIQLKTFYTPDSGPTEIIIQAIGGARILNGNKEVDQGYNWNQVGNTAIPVFDAGNIRTGVAQITKYTFKDLVINSEEATPFGCVIGADIGGATGVKYLGLVSLINTKCYNVWNIFGAYDSTGTFASLARIGILNPKVLDLMFRNSSVWSMTTTYLNHPNVGLTSGNFTGVGVWNLVQRSATDNDLTIVNNNLLGDNTFTNLFCATNIEVPNTTIGGYGLGNTIISSEVIAIPAINGFNIVNCSIKSIGNPPNNAFRAISNGSPFALQTPATFDVPLGVGTYDTTGTEFKFIQSATGATPTIITNFNTQVGSSAFLQPFALYEIEWVITIRNNVSGLTNAYKIIGTLTADGAGPPANGVLSGLSTIYVNENFIGVLGVAPVWNNAVKQLIIAPTFGADSLSVVVNYKISGFKLPLLS